MEQQQELPSLPPPVSYEAPPAPRLRNRVFPVLTALLASVCFVAAQRAADHVGTMNSARVVGALLAGPAAQQEMPPASIFSRRLLPGAGMAPPPPRPDPDAENARRKAAEQLQRQVGTVEVVIYVWRRVMWGVAGWLAAAALLSALTWRVRLFHLMTASVILLSTVGTLVGMWFLIHPSWGAMPPLPLQSHILTALIQSAYAWVLLVAFARRERPQLEP